MDVDLVAWPIKGDTISLFGERAAYHTKGSKIAPRSVVIGAIKVYSQSMDSSIFKLIFSFLFSRVPVSFLCSSSFLFVHYKNFCTNVSILSNELFSDWETLGFKSF